jgi:hypothetical protein
VRDLGFLDCHVWRVRRTIAAPSYRVLLETESAFIVEDAPAPRLREENPAVPVTRLSAPRPAYH